MVSEFEDVTALVVVKFSIDKTKENYFIWIEIILRAYDGAVIAEMSKCLAGFVTNFYGLF